MRRHIGIIGASAALALLAPGTATAASTPAPTSTSPAPNATVTAPVSSSPPTATSPSPSAPTSSAPTTGAPTSSAATSSAPSPPSATTVAPTAPAGQSAAQTPTPSPALVEGRLVPGGTSALAAPATTGPATSTDPAQVAAGFLARQLAAGGGYLTQSGFPDLGLTIDAILALDAAGVGAEQANASTQYIADHINEYIGPAWGETELYAGALGKAILLAAAQGADPRNFGGVDLVASLQSLEGADGGFHDASQYGDFSNTIGMTFDLIGLKRAGVDPTTNNVSWLLTHQCVDGGFAVSLIPGQPCASDQDATAYVIQALFAIQGSSPATERAVDYLASQQGEDGGVAAALAGPNTNTTGLAGQAFLAAGLIENARAAADFVLGFELGCTYPAALRGGIAFDDDDLLAADTATTPSDEMVRATTQALLVTAGTALLDITVDGSLANAPTLPCTTTKTTAPATPGTGAGTTQPAASSGSPGATLPAGVGNVGGVLANTGADATDAALLAAGLIALGAALVLATRRRGRHA